MSQSFLSSPQSIYNTLTYTGVTIFQKLSSFIGPSGISQKRTSLISK